MAPTNLTLAEYSDRELLHIVRDVADADGRATPQDIAERVGVQHEHPTRCVGSRLAWLRRYGAVTRDEEGRWALTAMGERYALGALSDNERSTFDQMPAEHLVALMSAVTRRYRTVAPTGAHLIRREWINGSGSRR